jgi:hypothetical protein
MPVCEALSVNEARSVNEAGSQRVRSHLVRSHLLCAQGGSGMASARMTRVGGPAVNTKGACRSLRSNAHRHARKHARAHLTVVRHARCLDQLHHASELQLAHVARLPVDAAVRGHHAVQHIPPSEDRAERFGPAGPPRHRPCRHSGRSGAPFGGVQLAATAPMMRCRVARVVAQGGV